MSSKILPHSAGGELQDYCRHCRRHGTVGLGSGLDLLGIQTFLKMEVFKLELWLEYHLKLVGHMFSQFSGFENW